MFVFLGCQETWWHDERHHWDLFLLLIAQCMVSIAISKASACKGAVFLGGLVYLCQQGADL